MKKSLSYLPVRKQKEIGYILDQIQKICEAEFIILLC